MKAGKELTVVGLGDPVMDVLFDVDDDVLSTIADRAGGCTSISHEQLVKLTHIGCEHCQPARVCGGSAANVMKGLANLSAGKVQCKFVGMVGADTAGAEYRQQLQQQGVLPALMESTAGPTATCLCFVTPDGQRTMRTCLGASSHLNSVSMLPKGWTNDAVLLHCEGYCLYRPQLAREAMAAAKKAGALVSMDLASFECVANCKAALLQLLQAGLIDMVFANEEEAYALLEEVGEDVSAAGDTGDRVEAAQNFVLQYAQICVVSLGARGCVARARGGQKGTSPAGGVQVVDTVGAGDYFTSGFLYAHLMGCSLQQCAAVGCAAGSEAVQTKGAVLSDAAWHRLRSSVSHIIGSAPGEGAGTLAAFEAGQLMVAA